MLGSCIKRNDSACERLHIMTTTRRKSGLANTWRIKGTTKQGSCACCGDTRDFPFPTSLATTLTRSSFFGIFPAVIGRQHWNEADKERKELVRDAVLVSHSCFCLLTHGLIEDLN